MTRPLDADALKIADSFRRYVDHTRQSVVACIETGRLLIAKKAIEPRGKWLLWLQANANVLGFSDRTANLLMKAARKYPQLTADTPLDPAQACEINRDIWGNHSRNGSGNCEWYTPPKFVELVKRVFGGEIDLDPASCDEANSKWVKARTYYTKPKNGLTQPWRGKVYLNPPFQAVYMGPFVDKLVSERRNGNCTEAVMLCSLWPEKKWFWPILDNAALLCLPREYVSYIPKGKHSPTGHPKLASVFSYWGDNPKLFADVFREIGTVVKAL